MPREDDLLLGTLNGGEELGLVRFFELLAGLLLQLVHTHLPVKAVKT